MRPTMSANKGGQKKDKRAGSASAEPSMRDWKVTIPTIANWSGPSTSALVARKAKSPSRNSGSTGRRAERTAAKRKLWPMRCGISGREFRIEAPSRKSADETAEWLGLTLLDDYEQVMAFDKRGWL